MNIWSPGLWPNWYGSCNSNYCDNVSHDFSVGEIRQIGVGSHNVCLVNNIGELYCWGKAYWHCPAENLASDTCLDNRKQVLPENKSVAQISMNNNDRNACILFTDGKVGCYGNFFPNSVNSGDLNLIPLTHDAVSVTVTDGRACALLETGSVSCFGSNYGDLGFSLDNGNWTDEQNNGTSFALSGVLLCL